MFEKAKKCIERKWILILIFLFWLVVGICSPISGDDWEISTWHRTGGLDYTLWQMINSWYTYTGRIVNNFFDAVITHYRWLWVLISASIHTLSIWMIAKINNMHRNILYIIVTFIFFISIGDCIRNEIQFYAICNVSYTICTFFILLFYYIEKNNISLFDNLVLNNIFWGFFCFFNVLWIENLTIGFDFMIVGLLFFGLYKRKKVQTMLIGSSVGAALGTVVLFSASSIEKRIEDNLTIGETISKNLNALLSDLIIDNMLVFFLVSVVLVIAISLRKKKKIMDFICLGINFFQMVLISSIYINEVAYNIFKIECFKFVQNDIYTYLLTIVVLGSILFCCINQKNRIEMLLLYFAAAMSVAPMILSPGSRNMIFAIYVTIIIMGEYLAEINIVKPDYRKIIYLVMMLLLISRIEDYAYVLKGALIGKIERNEAIREYKVRSLYAKREDDYVLILPLIKGMSDSCNSSYYKDSIINYYDLPRETIVLFDDGFLIKDFYFEKLAGNGLQFLINQYQRYGADYSYLYTLYKDGEKIDEIETGDTKYIFQPTVGTYQVVCLITNQATGATMYIESGTIIF